MLMMHPLPFLVASPRPDLVFHMNLEKKTTSTVSHSISKPALSFTQMNPCVKNASSIQTLESIVDMLIFCVTDLRLPECGDRNFKTMPTVSLLPTTGVDVSTAEVA